MRKQVWNKYVDLNVDTADKTEDTWNYLFDLCDNFSLTNVMDDKTCFKVQKGTSIDVLPTNRPRSFHKKGIFETGLSGPHKLISLYLGKALIAIRHSGI